MQKRGIHNPLIGKVQSVAHLRPFSARQPFFHSLLEAPLDVEIKFVARRLVIGIQRWTREVQAIAVPGKTLP